MYQQMAKDGYRKLMWRGVDRFWGAFALLTFWRREAKNAVASMREMGRKRFCSAETRKT